MTQNKTALDRKQAVQLNNQLLKASKAYYMEDTPVMSDHDYDSMYDLLVSYEAEHGVLPGSVTQRVGYEVVSALKKEEHERKALSLNKTKDIEELAAWAKQADTVLSWKMDGLTLVLTYEGGKLEKAVTRGNGSVGENITHNAPYINGIPLTIPFDGHLVVRGEAVVSYEAFAQINETLPEAEAYSLPRSFASGAVRKLDSFEMKDRGIEFKAFELVEPVKTTVSDGLDWLKDMGFGVVDFVRVPHSDQLREEVESWTAKSAACPYPVDGLVLTLDDVAYGRSLGTTDKYPLSGMAFKWADEMYETVVRDIVWQPSRTGRLTPVVVFDPVEIDGSTITRATGNNLSFLRDKQVGIGSRIEIYKANMVIPAIEKVVENPQEVPVPAVCPSCGAHTEILEGKDGSLQVVCPDEGCPAKHLEHFTHFVKRDAMEISGLAKNIMQMLIENGFVHVYTDLYHLKNHPEISMLPGFGQKSYAKLLQSIEISRHTTLARLLYSMGITGIGRRASRAIARECQESPKLFVERMNSGYSWQNVDGIGEIMSDQLHGWWKKNSSLFLDVLKEVNIPEVPVSKAADDASKLAGKTFVITGKITHFENRTKAGEWIEQHGGKLTGSVSKKTDFLVNNDTASTSGKNKKAKELGIPIISEEELLQMA